MLVLHHAPMARSLVSRLALIEAGLGHTVATVRTWQGEQKSDAYRAINPRGKAPALQTDAGVITESIAILSYIADLAPEAKLLPPAGGLERAKALAWFSFLSSTLHASLNQALFPLPGSDNEIAQAAALERVANAFADIDKHLEGRDHLLDTFSACDLYLLVFTTWRGSPALAGKLPTFANIDRFQQAMMARPGILPAIMEDMKLRASAA
jgi:glutathione S-transferase